MNGLKEKELEILISDIEEAIKRIKEKELCGVELGWELAQMKMKLIRLHKKVKKK